MEEHKNHNSFLPMLILLLAMGVVGAFQIYNGVSQKNQLDKAHQQLQPALKEAREIDGRLTGICRDLLDMESRNSKAKKIIQDFNIRSNDAAQK